MMEDRYKLDKGRVVVSTGGYCPFECRYCYTGSLDFEKYPYKTPKDLAADLLSLHNRIDIVQLGYDAEVFSVRARGVELIKRIAEIGKDISFATKMPFFEKDVDKLASIYSDMQANKWRDYGRNHLVAFISLTGLETAKIHELRVPSPNQRIEGLKRLHAAGIPSFVFIRPFLPSLSDDELRRLVDLTREHCSGYVFGKLYADDRITANMGVKKVHGVKRMDWALDQRLWDVYLDERIKGLVDGITFFGSSLEAVNHVRQKEYQEAVVEGVGPGMLGARLGDRSEIEKYCGYYSMRMSVPEGATRIVFDDDIDNPYSTPLVLTRNIFSGEIFNTIDAICGGFCHVEQPLNVDFGFPRAVLLEDGRLFVTYHYHNPFLNSGAVQGFTEYLLMKLEDAVRDRDSFVSACEGLESRLISSPLQHNFYIDALNDAKKKK